MAVNEKLSFWALGFCYCGRWQWYQNRAAYCKQGAGTAILFNGGGTDGIDLFRTFST